jgi:hypothetical protein
MALKFEVEKLVRRSLFGGKMTRKSHFASEMQPSSYVQRCIMDLMTIIVTRIVVYTHLMVFPKFC